GAPVIDLPPALAGLDHAHHVIERFDAVDAFAFEMRNYRDLLSPKLRARVEEGRKVTAAEYAEAQRAAQACRRAVGDTFKSFEVLLAPAVVGEAPKGLEGTGSAVFNRGWTLLGLPCITVPGLRGKEGMPVGVQLVGPYGEDARLLSFAAWLEK